MLGDWNGALADQAELERIAGLDTRVLPAGFTVRAYTYTAFCHELRGDDAAARRYIDLTLETLERARADATRALGALQYPPLARALAHRGRFDEAVAVIPLEPGSGSAGLTLEALCEIAAARADWDEAPSLAAAAREEAAAGELLSLPLFADRLEGRAAAASGDVERAAALLRRSADRLREARGALGGGVLAPPAGRGAARERRPPRATRARRGAPGVRLARLGAGGRTGEGVFPRR